MGQSLLDLLPRFGNYVDIRNRTTQCSCAMSNMHTAMNHQIDGMAVDGGVVVRGIEREGEIPVWVPIVERRSHAQRILPVAQINDSPR